ncbi:uncharacterized protein LOC103949722 [Pyrus x bretschneideri]|uniref:uncharacterized protein LOC103949722 n=1 Tax=Pyrus x bretschneideri TaxID=225117 RepID=UPI00202E5BFE|nr:uncharacterized protein LOC103949722 [Pyrus x bretschneideri]
MVDRLCNISKHTAKLRDERVMQAGHHEIIRSLSRSSSPLHPSPLRNLPAHLLLCSLATFLLVPFVQPRNLPPRPLRNLSAPRPLRNLPPRPLRNLPPRPHLLQFLSLADADVLAEMPPLDRAHSLLMLSKATTLLFALRLRCTGVNPFNHPVKTEFDRLKLYEEKLEKLVDLSKAPLRPSTTLNHQAATRFIEHSLPDLTPDQRQSMRAISKGDGPTMKYLERNAPKKRKYQSPWMTHRSQISLKCLWRAFERLGF